MLSSMTGFGSKQANVLSVGQVRVEFRSTNHKFLDLVLHLPEGFLSVEEKIKKALESRIKRGRVTCVLNITRQESPDVFINEKLMQHYLTALRGVKSKFQLKDDVRLDTLIHLPGLISLSEPQLAGENVWLKLKPLVEKGIEQLVVMRQKEGRALEAHLKSCLKQTRTCLDIIEKRSKVAVQKRCKELKTNDERCGFMKEADISEEVKRLSFHIRNFRHKISARGPMGKELDFIAQEMQRESNTIGAKSFDALISAQVVKIKSQIEKIREQSQNVE